MILTEQSSRVWNNLSKWSTENKKKNIQMFVWFQFTVDTFGAGDGVSFHPFKKKYFKSFWKWAISLSHSYFTSDFSSPEASFHAVVHPTQPF